MNENHESTPAPDAQPKPLQKYSIGVIDHLLQNLKAERYDEAPQFLRDLSDFLRKPIDPKLSPGDMLKVLIGEMKRRVGLDDERTDDEGRLRRKSVDAFVTELGNFLQLCDAGETIRSNEKNGTHEEVRRAMSHALKKTPALPGEKERDNFLERIIDSGYILGGSAYYQATTVITKARPKSQGFLGRLFGAKDTEGGQSSAGKGRHHKPVRPREMLQHLIKTCKTKRSSPLMLHQIRSEAQALGVVFEKFPEDEDAEYPSEVGFVLTKDGHCLMVNRQAKYIQCDPEKL